jgi:hypothetical protein
MDHAITRATGAAPSTTPPATARRTRAILLTSANHGVVGPLGSTFPHAGEHHERVQVVELVEAGTPPAPDADLAGLLRFNMAGEPVAIEGAAPVAAQAGQVAPAKPLAMVSPSELRDIQAGRGGVPVRGNQWRADQTVPIYAAPVAGQVAVAEGVARDADRYRAMKESDFRTEYAAYIKDSVAGIEKYDLDAVIDAAAPSAPAVAQQAPEQATPVPAESIECWSHNEEDFNARSLAELVSDHELQPGATVWVGEAVHPEPKSLFSTDWLIENMGEAAYDIAGEHAGEDYPNVSDDQVAELEALIVGWIAKCAPPNFWTVKNVRAYVLTAEDCGAQASTAGERQEGGDRG